MDSDGRILARAEVPTLAKEGLEPVMGRIVNLGRDLLSRPEIADIRVYRIGVGCAGPVDLKAGVVFNPPNLPGWVRVPLSDRIQQALGLPTVLENDANAAGLVMGDAGTFVTLSACDREEEQVRDLARPQA